MKTMKNPINTQKIRDLRIEAASAGDILMVALCDRAVAGDPAAWEECRLAIESANAQSETDDMGRLVR